MPGLEISRFVDLSEREAKHLICSICLNIFDNALNSDCGHTFCTECLQKWIEDNHNECPECRRDFRRVQLDQSNHDCTIELGHFQFTRSLKINIIISELKVKCDFDFNGCQQLLELGLHSTHIKTCEYRLCKICQIDLALCDQHKCIDILRNKAVEESNLLVSRIKQEFKAKIDLLTTENEKLRTKIQCLESLCKMSSTEVSIPSSNEPVNLTGLTFNTLDILFGTHSESGYVIDFIYDNMNFSQNSRTKFFIKSKNILEVMYCSDLSFPILILTIDDYITCLIRWKVHINNSSDYDVTSPDPTKKYMIIEINGQPSDIFAFKSFVQFKGTMAKAISSVEARYMVNNARGSSTSKF